jgi:GWxTD domain-containing protein
VDSRNRWIVTALLAALVLTGLPALGKTELPPRDKKWLDEEVDYIISPVEREVFQKLQTDRERELFIEAFWKHRDPTPETPDNEFKTEHYRRIAYANRYLGRESTKPGWRTDRGRMYIILGEPNDINRYSGKTELYDCEVWFYQGKTELGLPAGFNLLFFKPNGQGEFRLYSPAGDGPGALMPGSINASTDYAASFKSLNDIDPLLAGISLSLIPGETSGIYGRPSLVSDLLIQRIINSPQKMVEEKYARKFLEYKDVVEVEYSANYLDSDSLVKVLKDPSGTSFVHYVIEPKKLSLGNYEQKYYTTMRLNGTVTAADGRLVHQFDKTISLEMNEEQMKERSHQPLDIQDAFPIVPGDYRVTILIKNEVSKEFTSLEQSIRVPAPGPGVQMTAPILAYQVNALDTASRKIRPFQMGASQLVCQPGRVFLPNDSLAIAFQLNGLPEALPGGGEIKYSFSKDDQAFREIVRKTSDYPGLPDVIEKIALADFPPAHYRVKVALSAAGTEIVSAADEFDVTFQTSMPRPWLYTRVLPEASDPFYDYILGLQLLNLGRLPEAQTRLEAAFHKRPEEDIALNLGRVYFRQSRFDFVEPLLAPFLNQAKPAKFDLYILAARACQSARKFDRAIEIFDASVSHYGVTPAVLNSIGQCYYGLGKMAEARAVWEKSLAANPDQPEIRKLIDKTKSKD